MIYDPSQNIFIDILKQSFNVYEKIATFQDNGKKPLVSENYKKAKKYMDNVDYMYVESNTKYLNDLFDKCEYLIKNTDPKEWYLVVRDYIYFVKICEKAFMYNNDGEDNIYCEIDELKDLFTITANSSDYKIKISFQDSSINMPGTYIDAINDDEDDPLDFMKDKSSKSNKVLFINIDVSRNFGTGMSQSFKFIYNSDNNIDDDIDKILLNVIENIISDMIYDQFVYILSNVIISKSKISHSQWLDDLSVRLNYLNTPRRIYS